MRRHEDVPRGIDQHLAADRDTSTLRAQQAGDQVDHRALARARATEQRGQRAVAGEGGLQGEIAAAIVEVDVETHTGRSRRSMRRAPISEASRAASEIATDTRVRRNAAMSPSGTCV